MFSKTNLLATITGGIAMFLLGYLIWGMAMVSFFESHSLNNIMKDPPAIGLIFIANLIQAFAMSTLYNKWSSGTYSTKNGFEFGAWIGIFIGLGLGLLWFSTSELMDTTGTLVGAIIDIIFYGIIGGIIGLTYSKVH